MTCIVAVKDNQGNFAMAADRMIVSNNNKGITVEPKIWSRTAGKFTFLMGAAGSWAYVQAFRYKFEVPDIANRAYISHVMNTDFLKEVHRCVEGIEIEDSYFHLLVVVKGRIFSISNPYTVQEINCDYYSIGSGMDFALGSLYAMTNIDTEQETTPEWLAAHAVDAACALDADCSGPVDVLSSHT